MVRGFSILASDRRMKLKFNIQRACRYAALMAVVSGFSSISLCQAGDLAEKTSFKFQFAPGRVAPGYIQVSPGTTYSQETGYGFDLGTKPEIVARGEGDPSRDGFCTSEKPFFFSVKVPEGNYRVTVTHEDIEGESITTVKGKLCRLMLERVRTRKDELVKRSFTVNVRTPKIAGDGEVRVKDREKKSEVLAWDEKLTLEFNDDRPCVVALEIAKVEDATTVYLLGDSTVCDQPLEPWNSWGQMLTRFFKPGVAVANNAESGESLKSSLGAHRLDKVLSTMKPGDYLFVQYGHNDMKEKGEGIGAFTSYKTDLKYFVTEARKRGGIPVVVTSMNRKNFDASGKITNTLGDYPEAVRQLAKEEQIPLIDLHAMSKTLYEAIGPKDIAKAFQDGTHHNNYGSYELAKCMAECIKADKQGLVKFIARDITRFDS